MLPGAHKFTDEEAFYLDNLFANDARWQTHGKDINLSVLAEHAADVFNAKRPPDAPKVASDTILNRRTAFWRDMKVSGKLARTELPTAVPLAFSLLGELDATINGIDTGDATTRSVVALMRCARADCRFAEIH